MIAWGYIESYGQPLFLAEFSYAVENDARGTVGVISYSTTLLGTAGLRKVVSFVFTPTDSSTFTCKNSSLIIEDGNPSAVSMLLTAKSTGKKIHAQWDTDVVINGFCKMQTISLY